MESIPTGFILVLLGIFAGALVITVVAFVLKQWRLQRLKNPRRDYYKERG